jgi:hypothetical protein
MGFNSAFKGLITAVDGSACSSAPPDYFSFRERILTLPCIGGWVGIRVSLSVLEKRKMFFP